MKSLLQICSVMAGLAFISPANATCTLGNIAGTWTTTSVSQTNTGDLGWVACSLVINANGQFSAATSKCEDFAGEKSAAQGSLKLVSSTSCGFQGSITLTTYNRTYYGPLATLSLDHYMVSGVGGGLGTGSDFVFNMVRTK